MAVGIILMPTEELTRSGAPHWGGTAGGWNSGETRAVPGAEGASAANLSGKRTGVNDMRNHVGFPILS